jgi:hypothetical protein
VESPTVPPFIAAPRTVGVAKTETKVIGNFNFESKGYYNEPTAGIENTGPYPPKVNQPTQFTIHWIVKTYNTDVRDIEASSFLGGNVRFTGVIKTNASTTMPEYNNRTQEISWHIPFAEAAGGILREPIEAVFQVEITPSTTQINSAPVLVNEIKARAIDDFTGTAFERKVRAVTTRVSDDTSLGNHDGRVVP